MKVEISVGGKFHAFRLAAELERRSYLERLITSYPKSQAARMGIPDGKVRSVILKEILERGWRRSGLRHLLPWNPQYVITEIFDRLAARKVIPADIFVGWANQSLHSSRKAKAMGAKVVLERGSSHILYQDRLLREEYERWSVPLRIAGLAHPKIIEKELREYEEADYISTPSAFTHNSFIKEGFAASKLIHVPYGVDLSRFSGLRKEDGKFRAVFTGGMALRKGVHYLLQAWSELRLPNAELILIGTLNDEMEPFFKKYAGSFKHLGHVPNAELQMRYAECSVFVMPSIEEGLALVMAEAMASGLPIIATTNTGAEDIVRDGQDGFIVPIRDAEALKAKLLYLYEHPEERKQMGTSARERVGHGFTWSDYGDRVVREYERILSSR